MDTSRIRKPSARTVGISTLVLSLLGLIAGAWYYHEHTNTRTQRIKRKANRQIKRVRGQFQDDHLSSGARTGLAVGALGAAAALLLGGSEVYRRNHK
ncbi:hypothetical protein SAMN05216203_0175 [Marinobacter daqiaonensis]|uniref:Uncharacterized protein n=1 Tax=Marinobacter daqiaonensis TaxID=650891 RepID=A0A1I6GJJ0_9GAMM|nr:hypothetical protein [Marinobacter daqiaonensis]SFR42374.1 hypothetical protein SAMN05216203_0175 [Marinobacter daqiaonensis]